MPKLKMLKEIVAYCFVLRLYYFLFEIRAQWMFCVSRIQLHFAHCERMSTRIKTFEEAFSMLGCAFGLSE